MRATMMRTPLSLNQLLERAGKLYPESQIVSRLPDKSLRRHRFADFYRRSRQLAGALLAAGLKKGERVATLCWNHPAHLECHFLGRSPIFEQLVPAFIGGRDRDLFDWTEATNAVGQSGQFHRNIKPRVGDLRGKSVEQRLVFRNQSSFGAPFARVAEYVEESAT